MNYEFVQFYLAVCKGLGVDPSVKNPELFNAITEQYRENVDCGWMIGGFDETVSDAVEKIANDERWTTRITNIEDVREGDLVTITVPAVTVGGTLHIGVQTDISDTPTDRMIFHYAIRKGFHAAR